MRTQAKRRFLHSLTAGRLSFYLPWDGKMSSNSFTWITEGGALVQLTGVA